MDYPEITQPSPIDNIKYQLNLITSQRALLDAFVEEHPDASLREVVGHLAGAQGVQSYVAEHPEAHESANLLHHHLNVGRDGVPHTDVFENQVYAQVNSGERTVDSYFMVFQDGRYCDPDEYPDYYRMIQRDVQEMPKPWSGMKPPGQTWAKDKDIDFGQPPLMP